MDKKISQVISFLITVMFLVIPLSGCVEEQQKTEETLAPAIELDQPSILPDWQDGEYHDYYETTDLLQEFQISYPDLVNVFSIGQSVLGKDIWCIRITNENNTKTKSSCLIDGCIHGCEWEAGEACLYLAKYLLINFGNNETITHILNSSEVYIVPLVNPDGRQDDYRYNENGIDLNRNFDIDFGRLRGGAIPLGKLFGRIKIPYLPFDWEREYTLLHKLFPSFPLWLSNCGRHPFSEPETQALRDLMKDLDNKDFSFYLNCHTAGFMFFNPWDAFKPPFEIPYKEQQIYDYTTEWFVEKTEYIKGENNYRGGKYYLSGGATDWCYKEFQIPSFAVDFLSVDYDPGPGGGKHDNLVYFMKTTLPVFMYLLVNIDNLREWKTPDIEPLLPEGVPPEPLQ